MDSTQRNQLGIKDHVQLTDFFRAHETSHQWWGHVVGWKSYHDQWLSEGFAEFSGNLYTGLRRGPQQYDRLVRNNRKSILAKDPHGEVFNDLGAIYAGRRLASRRHPRGYNVLVYEKGSLVLHMLRMMLWDTGSAQERDHRFIRMMHEFTSRFRNQAASTDDFKEVVEKHMTTSMDLDGNGSMDWFFDSWVYGNGIPAYTLEFEVQPAGEAGQFVLSGKLTQSEVDERFRTLVPVELTREGQELRLGWLPAREAETSFDVTLPFRPEDLRIAEDEILVRKVKYRNLAH